MSIALGSNNLGYPEFAGGDAIVYRGNQLQINKLQYANWTPVSQSYLYGWYSSNQDLTGSYNASNGIWYRITGSFDLGRTPEFTSSVSTASQFPIYDNPNYIQSTQTSPEGFFIANDTTAQTSTLHQYWVRPYGKGGAVGVKNTLYTDSWSDSRRDIWEYFDKSNNDDVTAINFYVDGFNGEDTLSYAITSSQWIGKWHNVAFAFDYTNKWRKIYVDGQLVASSSFNFGSISGAATNEAFLGSVANGSFNGSVESIVYYYDLPGENFTGSMNNDMVLANYNASKHLFQY
jgi:hypothetical protein